MFRKLLVMFETRLIMFGRGLRRGVVAGGVTGEGGGVRRQSSLRLVFCCENCCYIVVARGQ